MLAGCVMAGCFAMTAACGAAAPHPAPSPVLSNYERSTGNAIRRDCGYSSRCRPPGLPFPPAHRISCCQEGMRYLGAVTAGACDAG